MCADKSADSRYGTEAFLLGGFTETLGCIQAAILKLKIPAFGSRETNHQQDPSRNPALTNL